jgi:hypothetical protein
MRKSNKLHSQRGLKRHLKNVRRKERTNSLKDFNNLVAYFKWVQDMRKQQEAMKPALLTKDEETNG